MRYEPDAKEFFDRIERFTAVLVEWGARMNLTAAPGDDKEIFFHMLDSLAPAILSKRPDGGPLIGVFGPGRRILDIGTGAGFPGLILAAATEAQFTLVESRRRRSSFLAVAAGEMGLHNVTVEPIRATGYQPDGAYDAVVSRGVGAVGGFYEIASGALKHRGLAILYANEGQYIGVANAEAFGLGELNEAHYVVRRGDEEADRMLAIWRKL
ncbi:MAG TPA: RsmG family class I SAM-dependent methyltransferase [Candidatus Binataceae bacterium]|nr:RsmG family class I SAM-dependent methyltransferase [Candidatus Binataceae bacterium]